jgi:hypothetical protein
MFLAPHVGDQRTQIPDASARTYTITTVAVIAAFGDTQGTMGLSWMLVDQAVYVGWAAGDDEDVAFHDGGAGGRDADYLRSASL